VIQAHPDSFEEISFDAVTIKEFEKNRSVDYRLDFIFDEGSYFILSPKDVIKAMPRSFDDHIRWLMERSEFEQALEEIKNAPSNTAKIYTYQVDEIFLCPIHYSTILNNVYLKGCIPELH
jgi:hypothetical protein